MSRPATPFSWATDPAADIVEPAAGQKAIGWEVNDRPPAGWMNWAKHTIQEWIDYLDSIARGLLFSVWHLVTSPVGQALSAVARSDAGIWMVVSDGNQNIIVSPDRIHWTQHDTGRAGYLIHDVAHDQSGRWVIVGEVGGTDLYIYTSDNDGVNWTQRHTSAGMGQELRGVAHNGALWVACGIGGGNSGILTSLDGATWTQRTTDQGFKVTWNTTLDMWCVVGPAIAGEVFTAPADGLVWTPRASGVVEDLNDVTVNLAGEFIAVGNAGVAIRSADGINWAPLTTGTTTALNSVSCDQVSGSIIAVGNARNGMSQILTSFDGGDTWIDRSSLANTGNLHGAHCIDDECVIGGAGGLLLTNTKRG